MLLNLSGAHGRFFTRNIVILKDSAGNTGLGEVPGGEKIRQTIDDARSLVDALSGTYEPSRIEIDGDSIVLRYPVSLQPTLP